jgi:carotenoid cleavage dioxygenase-like enzyme
MGESDLGGVVPLSFSAHPHAVAARRATYGFGVRYGRRTMVDLFELPWSGTGELRARRLGQVQLGTASMIHDFAATERHLVLLVPPLSLDVLRLFTGRASYSDALRWQPSLGTEVIVIPIDDPSRVTRFTVEPFYQWHIANAYDRDGEIVVDLVRYPDFSSNAWVGSLADPSRARQPLTPGSLHRATIDPGARKLRTEERWSGYGEFPGVAPGVSGREHRFVHMAALSAEQLARSGAPDRVARVDVTTGRADVVSLGDAQFPSEILFVPRPGASPGTEDDGWLLTLVYDARADRSHVAILDARDPHAPPLARAWFDQAIPFTFHGAFAS